MEQSGSAKHKHIATLWLVIVMICCAFCLERVINHSPFYSNLLELLPEEEKNPVLHDLSRLLANRFQQKFFFLVKSDNNEQSAIDAEHLRNLIDDQPLLKASNDSIDIHEELVTLYRPYVGLLLPQDYTYTLRSTSIENLTQQTLAELFSPVSQPRPYPFTEDPLNIGGKWLDHLHSGIPIRIQQGFPTVKGWFLVSGEIPKSPFELDVQSDLNKVVKSFKQQNPSVQLLTSGMLFHASAGTQQAQQEIRTVGLGSLLAIILLSWLVFRSVQPLASIILTLSVGCVVALTVSLLVFKQIHLLTLAFGSTLLGVAVDYAFHFIIKTHQYKDSLVARRLVKYPLAVGALSSICAYLMQLTTPFPGLQQMAIFSASGLAGAWLTVMFWGPLYRVPKDNRISQIISLFSHTIKPLYHKARCQRTAVTLFILMAFSGSWASLLHFGNNDDIANLNTSTEALIGSEKTVQQLLEQPSTNRFFYVNAQTEQGVLEKLEQLTKLIKNQAAQNLSTTEHINIQSITKYVPSIQKQKENQALIEAKLLTPNGVLHSLNNQLGIPSEHNVYQKNEKPTFYLEPHTISGNNTSSNIQQLYPPILISESSFQTLLTLDTQKISKKELIAIADNVPGVRFIDQNEDISSLLGRYRENITHILLITLLILAVGLTSRYKQAAWRILLPVGLAIFIALGTAASLGGLTIFHLMALLLVLGIGVDTAVFYLEVGFNSESWLAATLSSLTSIFAFGLLALSNIPVLHQFGIIILTGILGCWLITPLFHTDRAERKST